MQQRARLVDAHRRASAAGRQGRAARRPRRRSTATQLDVELVEAAAARHRSARRCARGRRASTSCRSQGGGWGRVPMDVVRQARRPRSPICSRPAAATTRSRSTRCPISRGCARSSTSRRRPSSSASRPLLDGFAGHPARARCRGGLRRRAAARTSSAASTGSRSAATPASAACSPTTWASARRSRRSRRSTGKTLVVSPTSVLFNWLAETAQVPPGSQGRDLPRRAPRARHRRRRDRHELPDPAQRHRRPRRRRVGHRDPRRVADDQEPRQPGRARRLPAARRRGA